MPFVPNRQSSSLASILEHGSSRSTPPSQVLDAVRPRRSILGRREWFWSRRRLNSRVIKLGLVQLRATLDPMYAHLRVQIATIAGFLILAALFSLALSGRLQKVVSQPILALGEIAARVSMQRDYSMRAP